MTPRNPAAPESRRKAPEAPDARTEIVSELRRIFAERPTWGKCFLARTGLEDGRPLILREVAERAERFGFARPVTRERIRQVTILAEELGQPGPPRPAGGEWYRPRRAAGGGFAIGRVSERR